MDTAANFNENRSHYLIIVISLFAIICLLWGANGVRGTDQYWYLGNVESISSDSEPVTNIYYPGIMLREARAGTSSPNYFTHNGPILHLSGYFARYFGEYRAWMLINLISHLLVAFCIYSISKRYTNLETTTWVTCLYLLSPIAIWQTLNMLQEQSHAGLMAAIFLCYSYNKNLVALILLAGLLAIGTTAHPIFYAIAICFSFYLVCRGLYQKNWLSVAAGILAAASYFYLKSITQDIFPSQFQPDIQAIIKSAIPGLTSINWQLSELQPDITAQLFFDKFREAIKEHFMIPMKIPFYFYTNLSVVAFIYLVVTNSKKYVKLLIPISIVLGLYVAILLLMQTHMRYQQIVAPLAFTAISLAAYELRHKIPKNLPAIMLAATAFLTLYMAHKVHKEGSIAARGNARIIQNLSTFGPDESFVSYDNLNEFDIRFSYLVRPRKLLVVQPMFLDIGRQLEVIDMFQPDYFISKSPIDNKMLPIDELSETEFWTPYGIYYIYPFLATP